MYSGQLLVWANKIRLNQKMGYHYDTPLCNRFLRMSKLIAKSLTCFLLNVTDTDFPSWEWSAIVRLRTSLHTCKWTEESPSVCTLITFSSSIVLYVENKSCSIATLHLYADMSATSIFLRIQKPLHFSFLLVNALQARKRQSISHINTLLP